MHLFALTVHLASAAKRQEGSRLTQELLYHRLPSCGLTAHKAKTTAGTDKNYLHHAEKFNPKWIFQIYHTNEEES